MDSPSIRLELESRPECVTLVRSALAGVGESMKFESELLDDLKTAVSEACNNVAVHAYEGAAGPLVVKLDIDPEGIHVVVRDRGGGMRKVASSEDRMGVGLAVISALADRAEFLSAPDGGTEVRMTFDHQLVAAPGGPGAPARATQSAAELPEELPSLAGDVVVTLSPVVLVASLLGRLARTLAASAHFSLDRFSDLYLVADAVAAHAQTAATGARIGFAIASAERRLELTIGPLQVNSGTKLGAGAPTDRPRSPLALLADELSVEPVDGSELLHLVLIDRRPSRTSA
ncbi:MAG: ATP-binding protein [Solirubrobacterales bacterium]|nr:ATP-binding protein [Solirubrobacterales bacterium]MBV9838118.1 ATP-binding protein [Solirubrobacterales bacterium]